MGKPKGKRPIEKPRRYKKCSPSPRIRCSYYSIIDYVFAVLRTLYSVVGRIMLNGFEEVGCDPGDWIILAEDRDQWRAYVRAIMNIRVP